MTRDRDRLGEGEEGSDSGRSAGLVAELTRWEDAGGQWKVLRTDDAWIELGLFTCVGEQMSHLRGARTSVLASFLAGRTSSTDEV